MTETTTLKIPKLQGSQNWDLWSIRINAVLTEKGYNGFIPGIATAVETLTRAQSTEKADNALKALALIRLNLADGPLLQSRNEVDPTSLFNKLKALYKPKGFSSEFLICRKLFETTLLKSNNSVEICLNRIKRLYDDLTVEELVIPVKVIAAWTLNNLTPEYENIVTIITQSFRDKTDIIDLDQLFSQLIDESRRLKSKDDSEMALNIKLNKERTEQSNSNSRNSRRQRQGLKKPCGHCNKLRHSTENC